MREDRDRELDIERKREGERERETDSLKERDNDRFCSDSLKLEGVARWCDGMLTRVR